MTHARFHGWLLYGQYPTMRITRFGDESKPILLVTDAEGVSNIVAEFTSEEWAHWVSEFIDSLTASGGEKAD